MVAEPPPDVPLQLLVDELPERREVGAAGFVRGMGEVPAECLVPGEPSGKPLDEVEAGTRGGVAGEVEASGGSGSVAGPAQGKITKNAS